MGLHLAYRSAYKICTLKKWIPGYPAATRTHTLIGQIKTKYEENGSTNERSSEALSRKCESCACNSVDKKGRFYTQLYFVHQNKESNENVSNRIFFVISD